MASLMPASWNQIVSWIRQIEALQASRDSLPATSSKSHSNPTEPLAGR